MSPLPAFVPGLDAGEPDTDESGQPLDTGEGTEEGRDSGSHLTAISRGSDVYSMSGEKVGEVKDVEFDGMSGRPISVTIVRGVLFTTTITLPADKIATVEDEAVYLNIDEDELEKWASAPYVPYV